MDPTIGYPLEHSPKVDWSSGVVFVAPNEQKKIDPKQVLRTGQVFKQTQDNLEKK